MRIVSCLRDFLYFLDLNDGGWDSGLVGRVRAVTGALQRVSTSANSGTGLGVEGDLLVFSFSLLVCSAGSDCVMLFRASVGFGQSPWGTAISAEGYAYDLHLRFFLSWPSWMPS